MTKFGVCLDIKEQSYIPQVMGMVHLHVRTCSRADVPLFCILETAGQLALKFGVWLETHYLGVLQNSSVG